MTYKSISSTKFPKVMFSNAPIVSPALAAITSVEFVRRADKGTIAMALHVNVNSGPAFAMYATVPATTNMSRLLTHEDKSIAPSDVAKQLCVAHRSE